MSTLATLHSQEYLLNVRTLTVEDGFSNRILYHPFQDQEGYIWIGTFYGLDRYDGTRVKHYPKEEIGIRFNVIFRISEDKDRNLWLHYQQENQNFNPIYGVDIFDQTTEKIVPINEYLNSPLPFPEEEITWVTTDAKGSILIATLNGRVYNIVDRELKQVLQLPSGDRIHQLFRPGSGGLWVALWEKVIKFDDGWNEIRRFQKQSGSVASREDILETPFEDELGRLHYVAARTHESTEGAIVKWPYVDGVATENTERFPDQSVIAVSPGDENEYWVKRESGATSEASNSRLSVVSPTGTTLGNIELGLGFTNRSFFDNKLNLWTPTQDDLKLITLRPSLFKTYLTNKDALQKSNYGVRAMVEDGRGHLLVTRSGPTLEIEQESRIIRNFEHPATFNHPFASGLSTTLSNFAKDEQGNVWICDQSFRLLKYEPAKRQFTQYTYDDELFEGLDKNNLTRDDIPLLHRGILVDKRGTIWLGHVNGISKFDPAKGSIEWIKNESEMAPLSGLSVRYFHENDKGLWLVTSKGLFLFDPVQLRIVDHFHEQAPEGKRIPNEYLAHVYEDKEGFFWLATKGGGLVKLNPQTGAFEQFTTKDGLSNNVIYAVYEDGNDNLWLPTDIGINQFNKITKEVIHYKLSDGIANTEFNTASHYRGADSTLYFGGLNGITSFSPEKIVSSQKLDPSPLVITTITRQRRRDGSQLDYFSEFRNTQTIVLKPSDLGFSLDFSHLDYGNPSDSKQFAYKIDGVDANWIYQKTPSIRINALPYGNFELQIKAQESNGKWTEIIAFPVLVLRPFYLKAWFIIPFSLAIVALIIYLVRRRISSLERHKEELEQEVAERTAEIKQQNIVLEEQTVELEKQTVVLEKQANELKQLDSAKSQFFANISHELRTPLTLIMGPLGELLKEKTLDEDKLYKLKRMYRSSKGLSDLVEEILELSKLEAGKLEVHESPVLLMSFLKKIFSGFESLAKRKGIKYASDFYFDDRTVLSLDTKKVEKIINNLLSNALKFTERNGSVKIMARLKADHLKIVVKDSGRGIPEKDLPFVFDRFFQTQERDLNAVQGGTGIGLALVKELTEVMNGSIEVESEPGLGTKFEVSLPKKILTDVDLPSEELFEELLADIPHVQSAPEKADDITHNLLIVEDNPDMQEYVKGLLTPYYRVKAADNGLHALEILKSFEPHLIISDVMMPEMDGFTLLKRLKSNQLYQGLPVIMLTARAEHQDKLNALTMGVDDYLTKPFQSEELIVRVKNLLSNYESRKAFSGDSNGQSNEVVDTDQAVIAEVDLEWIKTVEKEALARLTDADFSIESLANHMNLGTRQFLRKIKGLTGLNSTQYLQEIRLQQSRAYLERGAYHTVAEVSYAVGFQSTKYYSRLFKARFGKSPSEYLG